MKTAGYSGTPLTKKLGIKDGFIIKLVNEPVYYLSLLAELPENIRFVNDKKTKKDIIHFFTKKAEELYKNIVPLKNEIEQNGMIWISWPKKAAKIETDITEDIIRDLALRNGLVDVKVCAVDEIWSGLKLVIPVKDRK
jgi:Protein of unknown function (DUF3052)